MAETKDKIETASIRFTDRTAQDRRAKAVFEEYLTKLSFDNPDRTMRPQEILTLALVELSKANEPSPAPDVFALLTQIKTQLEGLDAKIQGLVTNGILTHAQGAEVSRAIGVSRLGREFEENVLATVKPGRSK